MHLVHRRGHVWSRIPVPTLLLATLAFIAAGCGGGGNGEGGTTNNGATKPTAKRIEVNSGEFFFEPEEITVEKGQEVTLVVANDGSIAHNISIDEFGVKKDYNAAETVEVSFTADKAGAFKIYCDESGHEQSGMVGKLIVK